MGSSRHRQVIVSLDRRVMKLVSPGRTRPTRILSDARYGDLAHIPSGKKPKRGIRRQGIDGGNRPYLLGNYPIYPDAERIERGWGNDVTVLNTAGLPA